VHGRWRIGSVVVVCGCSVSETETAEIVDPRAKRTEAVDICVGDRSPAGRGCARRGQERAERPSDRGRGRAVHSPRETLGSLLRADINQRYAALQLGLRACWCLRSHSLGGQIGTQALEPLHLLALSPSPASLHSLLLAFLQTRSALTGPATLSDGMS
jgi:hypothetical protein